jgi:cytoskeletal protein RodZ
MFPAIMSMDAPNETSTDDLSTGPSGSRLLTRLGVGSSIIVHIAALIWIVFGTGVRLYNPSPTEAIAVELITPQEMQQKVKDKSEAIKETNKNDTLTNLDLSIPKPTMPDDQAKTALSPAASAAQAAAKQSAPVQQRQTAAQSPPAPPPQPASAARPSPPPPAPEQTTTAVAQPDIAEKYSTMLGLSDPGFTSDTIAAKIDASAVSTFRAHLRKCLQMPASVAADDKVRIVLRVALSPAGHLRAAPALIEASASPKGPLLMRGAIKALQDCQPYDMLPADKYKEWQVLDLSFTPRDFGPG